MHGRRGALHCKLDSIAAFDGQHHFVQACNLPNCSGNDRSRRRTTGARFREFTIDLSGATGKSSIDDAIERNFRSIGDRRGNVSELDVFLATRIKRQLADFVAR